jgi:hypothetical protein
MREEVAMASSDGIEDNFIHRFFIHWDTKKMCDIHEFVYFISEKSVRLFSDIHVVVIIHNVSHGEF